MKQINRLFSQTFLALLCLTLTACSGGKPSEQEISAIKNNLRQIDAAALQFCMENGTKEAKLTELVGAGKMIPSLSPVAGESYPTIVRSGEPLAVTLPAGVVVTFP